MCYLARVFCNLASAPFITVMPVVWSRFLSVPVYFYGEGVTRLLRWMLISGFASAGGGVPPIYYEYAWTPSTKRVGQLAGSFVYLLGWHFRPSGRGHR